MSLNSGKISASCSYSMKKVHSSLDPQTVLCGPKHPQKRYFLLIILTSWHNESIFVNSVRQQFNVFKIKATFIFRPQFVSEDTFEDNIGSHGGMRERARVIYACGEFWGMGESGNLKVMIAWWQNETITTRESRTNEYKNHVTLEKLYQIPN